MATDLYTRDKELSERPIKKRALSKLDEDCKQFTFLQFAPRASTKKVSQIQLYMLDVY